jgi:hypothetical protein
VKESTSKLLSRGPPTRVKEGHFKHRGQGTYIQTDSDESTSNDDVAYAVVMSDSDEDNDNNQLDADFYKDIIVMHDTIRKR